MALHRPMIYKIGTMKKITVLIVCLLLQHHLIAQEGELDISFNGNGKFILENKNSDEEILAAAMQADGKLLAVGTISGNKDEILAVRLDVSGNPDLKFGSQGQVKTDFGTTDSEGLAVAVQPDDMVLIAGNAVNSGSRGLGMVRLQSDGALDLSFGVNGKVFFPMSQSSTNFSFVSTTSGGKILVGGRIDQSGFVAALMQFNSDGTPDYSFGDSSLATIKNPGTGLTIERYLMRKDGGVQGVGYTYLNGSRAFVIVQFQADGQPESSFGSNGITIINFPDDANGNALAIQGDGKVVAGGYVEVNGDDHFGLIRLLPDGTLDQSFGVNGKVSTPILNDDAEITAVHVLGDGKIIAAGEARGLWHQDFAVARFSASGTLDKTFSYDGFNTKNIGTGNDYVHTAILQPNGRLVVFGSSFNTYSTGSQDSYDFAAARFLGGQGSIGVDEIQGSNDGWSIYPNPANAWVYFDFEEPIQKLNMSLIDQRGAIVKDLAWETINGEPKIDVHDLDPGLYIIKIVLNNGQPTFKKVLVSH